jgi:hypothetical protein
MNPASGSYVLMRVLLLGGADRAQIGFGHTQGQDFEGCVAGQTQVYWEWKNGATTHCSFTGISFTAGSSETFEVIRESASSNHYALIFGSETLQTTSSGLFGAPDNIYAGGASFDNDGGNSADGSYDTGPSWGRTADYANTAPPSWTAIQSSQQIVEGSWAVSMPPSPFFAEFT